jgi:hypothetical protein
MSVRQIATQLRRDSFNREPRLAGTVTAPPAPRVLNAGLACSGFVDAPSVPVRVMRIGTSKPFDPATCRGGAGGIVEIRPAEPTVADMGAIPAAVCSARRPNNTSRENPTESRRDVLVTAGRFVAGGIAPSIREQDAMVYEGRTMLFFLVSSDGSLRCHRPCRRNAATPSPLIPSSCLARRSRQTQ